MTERADQLHHDNAPAHSAALVQAFFWQSITSPRSVNPLQPRFGSQQLRAFPKAKITVEREEICERDSHTVHKLSQRCLTANRLAPHERVCSQMRSTVSSDWLPSYNKAAQQVLEIFKVARYFLESPCTSSIISYIILERNIALFFDIPVSVTEIYASKEIGVLVVITTKNSYTWNMTCNTKSISV